MLWRITGSGLPGDSFLFGTMHLRDQTAFAHLDTARQAILYTDVFATEFDLGDADPAVFQQAMTLPDALRLDEVLTAPWFRRLRKMMKKMNSEHVLEAAIHMKPIFFTNFITERMMGQDHQLPLDAALHEYATTQGKTITGVETFAEQVAIMHAIPLKYQVKNLKDTIKNISSFSKQLRQTTRLYEQGELMKLHKKAKKSVRGIRKLMLTDRNQIMADRIFEMARQQKTTFAIGAGHLMGKKGLIHLLKQKGLEVRHD